MNHSSHRCSCHEERWYPNPLPPTALTPGVALCFPGRSRRRSPRSSRHQSSPAVLAALGVYGRLLVITVTSATTANDGFTAIPLRSLPAFVYDNPPPTPSRARTHEGPDLIWWHSDRKFDATSSFLRRERLASWSSTSLSANEGRERQDGPQKEQDIQQPSRKNKSISSLRSQGIYARPSAALERGSGFFIPGLEGAKVRWATGLLLLGLTLVTAWMPTTTTGPTPLASSVAVLASLAILGQAAIETLRESSVVASSPSADNDDEVGGDDDKLEQEEDGKSGYWLQPSSLDLTVASAVEWAAATFVALTPATRFWLLDTQEAQVLYALDSLGRSTSLMEPSWPDACRQAGQILSQATSSRVALPREHPVVQAFWPLDAAGDNSATIPSSRSRREIRSVLLQRITPMMASDGDQDDVTNVASTDSSNQPTAVSTMQWAFLVASPQPLAAYTPGDLAWLGCLARQVSLVYQASSSSVVSGERT